MIAAFVIALILTILCIAAPILLIISLVLAWDIHLIAIFGAFVLVEGYCLILLFYDLSKDDINRE